MNLLKSLRTKLHNWLHESLLRKQILPAYLVATLACAGGVYTFSEQSDARADAVARELVAAEYQTCVTRVNTRDDVRIVFNAFIVALADEDAAALQALLDDTYPALPTEECVKP